LIVNDGVLIMDTEFWHGGTFDPEESSPTTESIRALTQLLTRSADRAASLIPVRDGFIVAYKV